MDFIVSGDKGSKKTITKHLQIVTIDLQMIIRQSFSAPNARYATWSVRPLQAVTL